MNKISFLLLVCIGVQFIWAQEDVLILDAQKMLVAELSGFSVPEDERVIEHRSTREERRLTRDYLSKVIETLGLTPELQEYTRPNVNPIVDLLFEPYKGANVYTILPATNGSDSYIVLGAHFDTERNCPGAIDNASGIAIGYGVLRKLAALKERNLNVILVYFDQEEEDLVGSKAFAQKLKKEELDINSVHSMDTMGWDRDGDKAVELGLATKFLEKIYVKVGNELNIPIVITQVGSSDHVPFLDLGFNATGLTDELSTGDYAPYKDTPEDTYNTVNFDYIASCTTLLYEVTQELMK